MTGTNVRHLVGGSAPLGEEHAVNERVQVGTAAYVVSQLQGRAVDGEDFAVAKNEWWSSLRNSGSGGPFSLCGKSCCAVHLI